MTETLLLEGGESTYNTPNDVVRESETLATASQQYWAHRQTATENQLARVRATIFSSEVQERWNDFCSKGIKFLDRLLWRAIARSEKPLLIHWKGKKSLSKDAARLFRDEAKVEIWFPLSHVPLSFAVISNNYKSYQIRPSSAPDRVHSFQLGMPYLAVYWREECFFVITPTYGYVVMETFCVDYPSLGRWSTGNIFPATFAEVSKEFMGDLNLVISHFAPVLEHLNNKTWEETLNSSLQRVESAAEAWKDIQLPEMQKIELLRALELFEYGDPASPRGLLLTGPPGVGKSLLGKTIAETVGCSFQHLTPASLKLDHLGGSGQRVREVWTKARQNQPAILYLDECEGVLGRRGAAETDALSAEIVQAFLAEWDGLSKTDRVLVIGATNRRDLLDDAILSRFGWEMPIALPSEADRIRILEQELKNVGVDVSLPVEFGALTQGMSGRDLQEVARSARRTAHPELPALEQISATIGKLRKGNNTKVSAQSKWENLVLDQKLLTRLRLITGLLRDAEKWGAEGISIPRSLLLQGSPGTGKTEIARTLANESELAFFSATTADLKANFLGQSGNRVKQIFERARAHAPCILFLDELDIIAPERSLGEDDPLTREIVGQLLQEIDGVQAHPEHVFLLGATNRPETVDRAVLSRFTERLQVPLPDHAARIRLLTIFLTGKKLDFSVEDEARLLADLTEGKALSGRDLRSWVASAEQTALVRAFENGGPEKYVITLDDFSSAT
jgi:SpoVK/Ycf46/Vps4 family AAA+-type ATPase